MTKFVRVGNALIGLARTQLLGEQIDVADAEWRAGGDCRKPTGLREELPALGERCTASLHGGLSFDRA